jgi:hypothetical protein
LRYWVARSSDLRELAVEEMVKQLTDSNFPHEWTELLTTVINKDDDNGKWVLQYVGKIDVLRNKKKLRPIRTRLKGYASAHKDKILTLGISPLTLAWKETYTGGDKAIDIDNVIDTEYIEEIPTPTPTVSAPDSTKKEGTYDLTGVDRPESAQSAQSALPSGTAETEKEPPNTESIKQVFNI